MRRARIRSAMNVVGDAMVARMRELFERGEDDTAYLRDGLPELAAEKLPVFFFLPATRQRVIHQLRVCTPGIRASFSADAQARAQGLSSSSSSGGDRGR